MVAYSRIIGVFDIDNITVSEQTKGFLAKAQEKGRIINICADLPRSVVLTDDGVYITQIASTTLLKRSR